jgi:hypothetical protein
MCIADRALTWTWPALSLFVISTTAGGEVLTLPSLLPRLPNWTKAAALCSASRYRHRTPLPSHGGNGATSPHRSTREHMESFCATTFPVVDPSPTSSLTSSPLMPPPRRPTTNPLSRLPPAPPRLAFAAHHHPPRCRALIVLRRRPWHLHLRLVRLRPLRECTTTMVGGAARRWPCMGAQLRRHVCVGLRGWSNRWRSLPCATGATGEPMVLKPPRRQIKRGGVGFEIQRRWTWHVGPTCQVHIIAPSGIHVRSLSGSCILDLAWAY